MLKKGDKVVYIGDPRHLGGTVIDIDYDSTLWAPAQALVEWDDRTLAPRQMKVPMVELKLATHDSHVYVNYTINDCECGLKYCRDGGKHSTWCKLYGRDGF